MRESTITDWMMNRRLSYYNIIKLLDILLKYIYLFFGEKIFTYNWAREYNVSLHIMNGYSIYFKDCEFLHARKYGVLSDPQTGITNSWLFFSEVRSECNQSATDGSCFEFSNINGGNNEGVYLDNSWAVSGLYGIVLVGVEDAKIAALDRYLSIGAVVPDQTIITEDDESAALVFRQRPEPGRKSTLAMGSSIDVWLTLDTIKIKESVQRIDSLSNL